MVKKTRLVIFGLLILTVVILTGTTVYFARKSSNTVTTVEVKKGSTSSSTPQEAGDVIAAVSMLILLPTDEVPTIATVSDPTKLKDQSFFNNATAGDKVLIYQKAKKAYLYNGTLNKLIEVAPISVGESTPSATTTPKSVPVLKK